MKLTYLLADPSGNRTALVLTPVPPERRAAAARQLMDRLGAEQAAFVHDGRMDMMGGEFCGNASRSFAVWMALRRGEGPELKPPAGPVRLFVTVSGAEEPLEAAVESGGPGIYLASIAMPLPRRVTPAEDETLGRCTLVEFPGISHLLLPPRPHRREDLPAAEKLLARMGAEAGCFGLLYREESGLIRPLVYVRETDSLVWESACGSGACAAAAALALSRGESLSAEIAMPGGVLSVQARMENGRLAGLTLGGPVTFPRWGETELF